jgi:hypothetical protein
MLHPGVSFALVTTVNNCTVFGILKETKLHPEAPCDHVVITTCSSSRVLVQTTSVCLHTESSICHCIEAIWNSSALMTPCTRNKNQGPLSEQIIVKQFIYDCFIEDNSIHTAGHRLELY